MPIQQTAPRIIGFPPVLISFIMLLLRPMAAIAMIIKNFERFFTGSNTERGTPAPAATVVITAAIMK